MLADYERAVRRLGASNLWMIDGKSDVRDRIGTLHLTPGTATGMSNMHNGAKNIGMGVGNAGTGPSRSLSAAEFGANGAGVSYLFWLFIEAAPTTYAAAFIWGSSSSTNRILGHIPFTDGNWYFDYGNSSGGRMSGSWPSSAYMRSALVGLHADLSGGAGACKQRITVDGVTLSERTNATLSTPAGPNNFGPSYFEGPGAGPGHDAGDAIAAFARVPRYMSTSELVWLRSVGRGALTAARRYP